MSSSGRAVGGPVSHGLFQSPWVRVRSWPWAPRPLTPPWLACADLQGQTRFTTVTFRSHAGLFPLLPKRFGKPVSSFHSPFALHGNNLAYGTVRVSVWLSLTWVATHHIFTLDSHIRFITMVFVFLSFVSLLGLSTMCPHKEVAPGNGPRLLAPLT